MPGYGNYERFTMLRRACPRDPRAMSAYPLVPPGFQRGVRFLAILVVLAGGPAAGVRAQGCEAVLAQAQNRYTAGAFEEIEAFVTACLGAEGAMGSDFVRAYRLQALAFLRLGDLDASRAQVLKLLGVYAAYEPDPVLDPPDYVGLVRFIKERLQVPATADAPMPVSPALVPTLPVERVAQRSVVPAPPPPLPSFEPQRLPDSLLAMQGPPRVRAQSPASRVRLEGALGLNDDVFDNVGAGLQFGSSYEVSPSLALGLLYEAGQHPTLAAPGDSSAGVIPPPPPPPGEEPPVGEPLSEDGSSPWLHQASAVVRATLVRWAVGRWAVEPYALAGVTAAVGRLDGTFRAGVGPRAGIGIEGAVGPRVAVFAEAQGTLAFPALVEDPTGGRSYSPLSSARVGLRFRLADSRLDRRTQNAGASVVAGDDLREPTAGRPFGALPSAAPIPDPTPPAGGGNGSTLPPPPSPGP